MKKLTLLILDLLILNAALALTLLIRYGEDNFSTQFGIHVIPFTYIFLLWILIFYIVNLYEASLLRNQLSFYSTLAQATIFGAVLSIAFFYLVPIYGITPKTNLFLFLLIFAILELGNRSLSNYILTRRFSKPIAIVGVNPQAIELARYIQHHPQLGYRLKYFFNPSPHTATLVHAEGFSLISNIHEIRNIIATERLDTVVVSPETYQIPELIDLFYHSLDYKVAFRNLASFYEQVTGRVPLGAINQVWFLENLTENTKSAYELFKRSLDTILVIIMGVITLVFFPLIALVIRLDSPGPIFYRQKRLGQKGRIFEIFKFRTMQKDAEKETGAVWAQEDDPRSTRTGRLLRKTRIDELPQLWNILRGDMSFVGPRAERPEFHDQLKKDVPFYEERYLIKPGLSGWAQINYRYGSSVQDAAQKLQYDLYYIKNRSLILDLGIILKTINISLRQAGR